MPDPNAGCLHSKNLPALGSTCFYRRRFATMVVTTAENTSMFCWLDSDAKVRKIPRSCFDRDSCFSRYVNVQERMSFGRTGWRIRSSSKPNAAIDTVRFFPCVANHERMEKIWAEQATSPTKTDDTAAASSIWKDLGSQWRANSMISSFLTWYVRDLIRFCRLRYLRNKWYPLIMCSLFHWLYIVNKNKNKI